MSCSAFDEPSAVGFWVAVLEQQYLGTQSGSEELWPAVPWGDVGSVLVVNSNLSNDFMSQAAKDKTGSVKPLKSTCCHPRFSRFAPFSAAVRVLRGVWMLLSMLHLRWCSAVLRGACGGSGLFLRCYVFTQLGRNPAVRSCSLANCPGGKFGILRVFLPGSGGRLYF